MIFFFFFQVYGVYSYYINYLQYETILLTVLTIILKQLIIILIKKLLQVLKERILINAIIDYSFNHCATSLYLCSKSAKEKTKKTQKQAIQILVLSNFYLEHEVCDPFKKAYGLKIFIILAIKIQCTLSYLKGKLKSNNLKTFSKAGIIRNIKNTCSSCYNQCCDTYF